jgi:release factor glutamine methyltransferase
MIATELARGAARLAASSPSARLDAELLLAAVLNVERGALRAREAGMLSPPERTAYDALIARREASEPVAYLLGRREFWSLELEVGPAVLVPRPETELLVEIALAHLAATRAPAVLDLGAGSGAIGLALARERADARVELVEASAAAAAVAERNRARHGLANARIQVGSWYEPVRGARFAAILANPPYLAASDPHLETPELRHEPRAALVAGPDGLEAIATIAAGAVLHLEPNGIIAIEHGADQGAGTRALFASAGLGSIATRRDLAGLERATLGFRPG